VYGNARSGRCASRQSSIDSADPLGAFGLAAMCRQASSLTCNSERPGVPPSAFCGAAIAMPGQLATSVRIPPKLETTSTTSSAPCAAASRLIASRSFIVPDGVSQCTAATIVTSSRRLSASLTAAGAIDAL
jgi:hypothetical protein